MVKDKYTAVWLSYSSITDYLRCPRAYFLKNIYRDPKTNRKITLMQPPLALGQTVHQVIESLSVMPQEERFRDALITSFEGVWQNVTGKRGGFRTASEEDKYKSRGILMMQGITDNPGPLLKKSVKIRQDLPYFWLSEEDNIILCGKIDWLVYDEGQDSVTILDFKTGKFDEDPDSLQLPIYHLLASYCQAYPVVGAQYWYLERDKEPTQVNLPPLEDAKKQLLEIARRIHLARKLEHFVCLKKEGCASCRGLEAVIRGEAEHIGVGGYNQDIYIL